MKVRELIEKLMKEDMDSEVTYFDGKILSINGKKVGKSETRANPGDEYMREYADEGDSDGYD